MTIARFAILCALLNLSGCAGKRPPKPIGDLPITEPVGRPAFRVGLREIGAVVAAGGLGLKMVDETKAKPAECAAMVAHGEVAWATGRDLMLWGLGAPRMSAFEIDVSDCRLPRLEGIELPDEVADWIEAMIAYIRGHIESSKVLDCEEKAALDAVMRRLESLSDVLIDRFRLGGVEVWPIPAVDVNTAHCIEAPTFDTSVLDHDVVDGAI